MGKGKDFYGGTVTDAIADACREFSTSQDKLNIEILETGSSGIFGLCRKKAHIRVRKKEAAQEGGSAEEQDGKADLKADAPVEKGSGKAGTATASGEKPGSQSGTASRKNSDRNKSGKTPSGSARRSEEELPSPELPSEELLAEIQQDITTMLDIMGFPSTVTVRLDKYTVACHVSEEYEDELVGKEGRTLDSLQYLLRKMTSRRLPERIMFSLDVGTYRERRAEELKEQALELATRVREEGKTQAIPALNPSERRVVHMVLQDDKTIRSRSVGAGLFKKVLIYKPGSRKKPSSRTASRKKKGKKEQQNERASEN